MIQRSCRGELVQTDADIVDCAFELVNSFLKIVVQRRDQTFKSVYASQQLLRRVCMIVVVVVLLSENADVVRSFWLRAPLLPRAVTVRCTMAPSPLWRVCVRGDYERGY